MTVWYHNPTIIIRRNVLRIAGLVVIFIALITTLLFANFTFAAPGINKTINFQGRLTTSTGAVVADGHYNMQFKIYQDGSGTTAGNPDGDLVWQESYVNNGGTSGVQVKNGFFSINLGSANPFGTSVDWNQDTLWLSMNIAGVAAACTTFGSAPCAADGEMLPMKRMASTPFALNAGMLGGKTADNFIQLAQGVQTDSSTNTSSIHINKTGTGNLVQLQSSGADVFTVTGSGNLALGNNADKTISVTTAGADTAGKNLTVSAGGGGTGAGSAGGDLTIQGGNAGGANGNGGDVQIDAGAGTGAGSDGVIAIGTSSASAIVIGSTSTATSQTISIGNNAGGGDTDVIIGSGGSADGGTTVVQAKNSVTIATDGVTRATFSDDNSVYFGNGVSAAAPNDFTISATNSSSTGVDGGSLNIQGGNATTGDANGGDITIGGGAGSGSGTNGLVVLKTPTFATVTNDANCYTDGAVVESSCSIALSSVNNSAAVLIGFSDPNLTATMPDPSNITAGRVMYIMASSDSQTFTLSVNGGGAGNLIEMRANTTATMVWNGSDWTTAGATSSKPLEYTSDGSRVQVGDGEDNGDPTLFTLDRAAGAPAGDDEALLGSMYYDTTVGALQCYEAAGWGACSESPDTFVTLVPEYSNAVQNGDAIGTMTSDLCSGTLGINNGTFSQPEVCANNETYNYYNWTSAEVTAQTKSIYVTYQLPTNFKQFVADSTLLKGRTDSNDATVSYEIYRNDNSGLTACGSLVSVSTGLQATWQQEAAVTDPSTCSFDAGDSIVFKINLSAANGANAYVSNLSFAFSNN